jgi:hypothetical protein
MVEEIFPEFAKNRHVLPLDCHIAISDSESVQLKDLITAWNTRAERNKVLDEVLEEIRQTLLKKTSWPRKSLPVLA